MRRPVDGNPRITSHHGEAYGNFPGVPPELVGKPHMGVDYSVVVGTPIYAPEDGGIIFAGTDKGIGIVLQGAFRHRLWHLSKCVVKKGDEVREGQLIAYSGDTGNVLPHLHWDVWGGGVFHDPEKIIIQMIDKKYLKNQVFQYRGRQEIYWHVPNPEAFGKYIVDWGLIEMRTDPVPPLQEQITKLLTENKTQSDKLKKADTDYQSLKTATNNTINKLNSEHQNELKTIEEEFSEKYTFLQKQADEKYEKLKKSSEETNRELIKIQKEYEGTAKALASAKEALETLKGQTAENLSIPMLFSLLLHKILAIYPKGE